MEIPNQNITRKTQVQMGG